MPFYIKDKSGNYYTDIERSGRWAAISNLEQRAEYGVLSPWGLKTNADEFNNSTAAQNKLNEFSRGSLEETAASIVEE